MGKTRFSFPRFLIWKNIVISAFLDPFRGCKRMSFCTLTPLLVRGGFRNFSDLFDSASASRATKRAFGLNHDHAPCPLTLTLRARAWHGSQGLARHPVYKVTSYVLKRLLMVFNHQQVFLNTLKEQLTLNM